MRVLVLLLTLLFIKVTAPEAAASFSAGAASVEISPDLGAH
ncbi:MAG: hypothetical protein RIQ93_761, partial [Verrucomicrobiota bacterium]